jgi:superoxide dismutase, Fe-Mn family
MKYFLPALPYSVDALGPVISREALEVHHGAHHQAYVDKLNDVLERAQWDGDETVEQLLRNVESLPDSIREEVRNFGGGHANHSLMWETMTPHRGEPPALLLAQIERDFGSLSGLRARFVNEGAALFGSGWVFLAWDELNRRLVIRALPNQDSPWNLMMVPLLPCDLWEHAHYLDYRNRRADWIRDWWSLVNWEQIDRRFKEL